MATPDLEENHLIAARDYGAALRNLGMDIDGLMWVYDSLEHRHVLLLITDFFDQRGPLEVSEMLFKAYNASATPQEIDPFIVRLHSINHTRSEEILAHASGDWLANVFDRDGTPKIKNLGYTSITVGGLEIRPEWVLFANRPQNRSSVEVNRRWKRFARNVEAIAA